MKHHADIVDSCIGKCDIIDLADSRCIGKCHFSKDFIKHHQDERDANVVFIERKEKDFKFVKTKYSLEKLTVERFTQGKHTNHYCYYG